MHDIVPYYLCRVVRQKKIIICDGLGTARSGCVRAYFRSLRSSKTKVDALVIVRDDIGAIAQVAIVHIADRQSRCRRRMMR